MSDRLRVTLLQRASSLDPDDNRTALGEVGEAIADGGADLAVWPEAFARDFGRPGSPLGEYAEARDGAFGHALHALAGTHGLTLVAGMFETSPDPDRPWNTLLLASPDQTVGYRKIHLYDSFGYRESDVLEAGPLEPVVADVAGFRVGLMTCYDLRFPELARALVDEGAEVLVLPAAWVAGARKVEHWRTLLRARAIENTAYVVAAAQPGPRYCGHSMVVAPDGDVLAEAGEGPEIVRAVLERDRLDRVRAENPSLANRRLGRR